MTDYHIYGPELGEDTEFLDVNLASVSPQNESIVLESTANGDTWSVSLARLGSLLDERKAIEAPKNGFTASEWGLLDDINGLHQGKGNAHDSDVRDSLEALFRAAVRREQSA